MRSTLYRNGVVHSPADPFAEALLVADGVVTWIGADDTAAGLAVNADTVVDLDGALVAPAFVDAHAHVLETGLALTGVDLTPAGGVRSLADVLAAVRRAADAAPAADRAVPLLGFGWDETAWPEHRAPTRAELDAAAGGRPVYLARVDVHSAVVSTSFAADAHLDGVPGWTPDGRVERDAHHAARAAARVVDPARREALLRRGLRAAAAAGIASVHEHSGPWLDTREGLLQLLDLAADPAGGLPHVAAYRAELCTTEDDARELLAAIPGLTGIGGDLNVDGSLGSRTAALREPYADDPAGGTGPLYLTAEQIAAHVRAVAAVGRHAAFHVIGDRAMDAMLAGLQGAAQADGASALRVAGHRIEHAEMVDAATLAALALLGVRLSMQPAFDAAWGGPDGMYAARLGAARAATLNPFAALAAAGLPLAFGSDSPVTPFDPWAGVRGAMTHHEPGQRISARAAFRAHTRGGWRAAGLDGTGAGEIRIGSPAHLAIWRSEHLAVQGPLPGPPVPGAPVAPDAPGAAEAGAPGDGAGRRSAWSTDARAGTPLLPDLGPDAPRPQCVRTVRAGVVLHDLLG